MDRKELERVARMVIEAGNDESAAELWNVTEFMESVLQHLAAPTYHVPGPYEIALQIGAALAASGKYDSPGAAMAAGWMSVPEFYQARDAYLQQLAPIAFPGMYQAAADDGEAA